MDGETKQKVTDTVMSILDKADMNVMTEYKVRQQASHILSIDLTQPEPKQFVRRLIQSYLDARASAADVEPQPHNKDADADAADADEETTLPPLHESEQMVEEEVEEDKSNGGSKEYDDDGDLIVCRLPDKRRVTIQDFKRNTLASIRENYTKDGKELPSSKDMASHYSQPRDCASLSQSQGLHMMDPDKIVNPGPIDDSVLSKQVVHHSEKDWNDPTHDVLEIKYRRMWSLDWKLIPFIARAGFYPWVQVQNIALDWALVTALVEHWRPETHTFHFRPAEITITLQDTALLTGLSIDGDVITGREESQEYWREICTRLLGAIPAMDKKSPTMAKRTWFRDHMKTVPDNASDDDLLRYARAYILVMIGSTLMPDTSGDRVSLIYLPLLEDLDRCRHYSWGSAVLAVLYRNMCAACLDGKRQIGGCLLLLQFWSWERLKVGRPKTHIGSMPHNKDGIFEHLRGAWAVMRWSGPKDYTETPSKVLMYYRDEMDKMTHHNQIIWTPYSETLFHLLNPNCLSGRHIWSAEVPLICFNVVEWHHPSRILRQFGYVQNIPDDSIGMKDMNHMKHRKARKNWAVEMKDVIDLWKARSELVIVGDPDLSMGGYGSGYHAWFQRITRKYVASRFSESRNYQRTAYELTRSARAWVIVAREAADMYFMSEHLPVVRMKSATIFHTALEELRESGFAQAVEVDAESIPNPNISI